MMFTHGALLQRGSPIVVVFQGFDIGAGALFKDLTGKYAKVLSRVHYLETGSKGFMPSLRGRKIYATGMGACFREDNGLITLVLVCQQ